VNPLGKPLLLPLGKLDIRVK
jgi:Ca2+-binding RTX toxin-like protein